MAKPVAYFIYARTLFIPLRYLYPECSFLIEKEDQMYPLLCLRSDMCHKDKNCMETLVYRVKYLFDEVAPDTELIVAYYKWRDKPNRLRAGLFDAALQDPRQITCNVSAFQRFQRLGDTYTWIPDSDFYLHKSGTTILPTEGLLHVLK